MPLNAIAIAVPEYAWRATVLIWLLMPPIALFNCPTFTASVSATPAATLVMRRSLPCEPTDTVLASVATEPAPSATEFWPTALAFAPSATALAPDATALVPIAVAIVPVACAL